MPHKVIRSGGGWRRIGLRELWDFRDLVLVLGVRDVKLRYRQTALGITWAVLQPLVGAGLFTIVFGVVARLPSHGVPYFLFSYAGFLGWSIFQSALTRASTSLVQNVSLVSKVYFPRLILPMSAVFSTLLDFGVGAAVGGVLIAIHGATPGVPLLLLPVWVLLLLMLGLGLGFYASALTAQYRDVQHVLPVLTQFILYASPVAYTAAAVPARIRGLYGINPLAGLLEAFRWSVLGQGEPMWGQVAYAAIVSIATLVCGAIAFRQIERKLSDVI